MIKKTLLIVMLVSLAILLASCTFNPFSTANRPTGSPMATTIGAGIGAGSVALLGGSKTLIGAAGLVGGAVGYYTSTLRYDAGGVMQAGGKVYTVGQYVGIYIPSDRLFEPNTAELLPHATFILDSAVAILERYPNNNIIVSGNTSGFGMRKWEQKLSEERAAKVAAYLWKGGVNNFKNPGIDTRKLSYVGYGDYFPLTTRHSLRSLRQDSRIQITSYPSDSELHIDERHQAIHNVGALDDSVSRSKPELSPCGNGKYKDDCYEM